MKKNILFLLLITALLFISGCTKNTDGYLSEVSAGQTSSPSAALSPAMPVISQFYYAVEKNKRQGIVNERGQVVLPFEYSKLDILYYNATPVAFFAVPASVKTAGQNPAGYEVLLFDLNGSLVYKNKCNYAFPYAYPVCEGRIMLFAAEKCGVISYSGKEIIPFRYNYISLCGDYFAAVTGDLYDPGKTADVDIYDKNGSLQNSGKLNYVDANGGLILIRDDTGTKYGLVDTRFEEVLPAEWDELSSLGNGLFIARRGEKYGVIDLSGKEVISVKYGSVNCFSGWTDRHTYFSAADEDGAYIFNDSGKQLFFSDKFSSAMIVNGAIIAQDQQGSHYINSEGDDIIPPAQGIHVDASGLITRFDSENCTCYTKEGNKLPLPEARSINIISPDRFVFAAIGSSFYGICDAGGGIIVPAKYTYMFPFGDENDLVLFMETVTPEKTRYGIIDAIDGSIILDGFNMLQPAAGGLFYAWKGTAHGLIDINGNWIWQASDYETLMD